MRIRRAREEDLPAILKIYERARAYQIETGNPKQWGDGYPQEDLLREDLKKKQLYVCTEKKAIAGVFVYFQDDEPSYERIDDGAWIGDDHYGVIHRIAAAGTAKGLAPFCFDWAWKKLPHLRIDTHEDNKIMQHQILKYGFVYCGIIYVRDGTPRLAYEKI